MCQRFYLSFHALNRKNTKLYKKALLNFAYFVNVLAILFQNFPVTELNLIFSLLSRIQGAQILSLA